MALAALLLAAGATPPAGKEASAAPAPVEPTSSFPFGSAKLSAPKGTGTLWGLWQALKVAGSVVRGDKGAGEHQAQGRWVRRATGFAGQRWEAGAGPGR